MLDMFRQLEEACRITGLSPNELMERIKVLDLLKGMRGDDGLSLPFIRYRVQIGAMHTYFSNPNDVDRHVRYQLGDNPGNLPGNPKEILITVELVQ